MGNTYEFFLESQGDDVWNAVKDGPFIPTIFINGVSQQKVEGSWMDDDKNIVMYDKKAITIISSAFGMDKKFHDIKLKDDK